MRLLDVKVVLDRDKGIQQAEDEPKVMIDCDDTTTPYAILSHRWREEVTYGEMIGLMKMEEEKREEVMQRDGYQKIIKSCEQAMKDGYEWLWVDTCCIDKRSSAELSEAINSMYRWYQDAHVCYAYLNDVCESTFPTKKDDERFGKSNGWPEWFVRGWTLQELIAPAEVKFFNKDWVTIGTKWSLSSTLEDITGIPSDVLTSGLDGKRLSVAQIMSWAAERRTTRVEDRAYSLMGLFGVYMPMVYGEGNMAFWRLQLEIIRMSSDQSIFAWNPRIPRPGSVLAEDPSDFRDCGRITQLEPGEFADKLINQYIERKVLSDSSRSDIDTVIAWHDAVDSRRFRTFTVSNAGIQVYLPVVPSCDSLSHCWAILACSDFLGKLVTIDLISSGHSFARTPTDISLPATYPEFQTLQLIFHQNTTETRRQFTLDDKYALHHRFTRRCTYSRRFTDGSVALSPLVDDLIVIVYANDDARSCFAIGLGYRLGRGWVHVNYDRHFPTQKENWTDIGMRAYDRMWKERERHARGMPKHEYSNIHSNDHFIKHAHLPRSIWAARVVWGRWEVGNSKVIIDVMQCPGCCDGPCAWTAISNNQAGLGIPELTHRVPGSYSLMLDERLAHVNESFGKRIAPGDYGDYSHDNLVRSGNIFEDMAAAGIYSTHYPEVSCVSNPDFGRGMEWMKNQHVLAGAHHRKGTFPALRQPNAISLPANEDISLLLKASSIRLAGKQLVTTIIQCSGFDAVDEDGKRMDSGDDSVPDSGNHSTEARILTPLCIIARPLVWSREPLCEQRRERFKSIREQYYALVDMHQFTGIEQSHNSANILRKYIAIKFFSDLFGLKYLKNYIGDITFFTRFPSKMETSSVGDVLSVGATEEDGLRDGRQFAATESDPRLDAALLSLAWWCSASRARNCDPRGYADESQRVEAEIKSISQTLCADLLEHIGITFCNASREHESSIEATGQADHMKYDRHLNTPSVIQDIKVLQAKLDATEDEDEQRALEEDVTGKILWLFWCGICAEVDEQLPKLVDFIRGHENMKCLVDIPWAIASTEPGDDFVHLHRILYDAGANISKYQLWLDARARDQAKWSGTNGGTPTINDEDMTPSTSRQTPSTPVVHTTAASVLPQTLSRKRKLLESRGKDAGADDEVANRDMRRLRRQAWYEGDD